MEGTACDQVRIDHAPAWVSVEPLGSRVVPWPPPFCCRRFLYFVPVAVNDFEKIVVPLVRDNFPDEGQMVAVLPTPTGGVSYWLGDYGTWWPTDPAQRESCYAGGRITVGVPHGA